MLCHEERERLAMSVFEGYFFGGDLIFGVLMESGTNDWIDKMMDDKLEGVPPRAHAMALSILVGKLDKLEKGKAGLGL